MNKQLIEVIKEQLNKLEQVTLLLSRQEANSEYQYDYILDQHTNKEILKRLQDED